MVVNKIKVSFLFYYFIQKIYSIQLNVAYGELLSVRIRERRNDYWQHLLFGWVRH